MSQAAFPGASSCRVGSGCDLCGAALGNMPEAAFRVAGPTCLAWGSNAADWQYTVTPQGAPPQTVKGSAIVALRAALCAKHPHKLIPVVPACPHVPTVPTKGPPVGDAYEYFLNACVASPATRDDPLLLGFARHGAAHASAPDETAATDPPPGAGLLARLSTSFRAPLQAAQGSTSRRYTDALAGIGLGKIAVLDRHVALFQRTLETEEALREVRDVLVGQVALACDTGDAMNAWAEGLVGMADAEAGMDVELEEYLRGTAALAVETAKVHRGEGGAVPRALVALGFHMGMMREVRWHLALIKAADVALAKAHRQVDEYLRKKDALLRRNDDRGLQKLQPQLTAVQRDAQNAATALTEHEEALQRGYDHLRVVMARDWKDILTTLARHRIDAAMSIVTSEHVPLIG